ncbi:bifunctional DNA primase/polymerase [Streptomyces sp. BA2]|uniref:bifunctional DNA primase/polymerase n=1 Tax=Streptomyces sp. BA2 TaxID=436595 RepID=UPI00132B4A89|nr:bifunctional DNA primase/polymerase [Streptomyces sp. BA2]MWA07890.1 DNA primase [Streptomyces sp. BA2]
MAPELRPSCSESTERAPGSLTAAPLLATAKWCAGNGWPVHPLAPGRKTPAGNCEACRQHGHSSTGCACLVQGRWCHGFRAATLNPDRIDQWWGNNPDFGVGVACGPAGLVIIDIDVHHLPLPARDRVLPGINIADRVDLTGLSNGFHTLAVLAALRDAASPADDETTLRVRTPSGGLHVWYRTQGGQRWQCSTGSSPNRALAWQVDVRAHGGYIVAPGTVTDAGTYTPLSGTREPAPLPDWLAGELGRTGHIPSLHTPVPRPVPPRARQAVVAAGGGGNAASRALAMVLADVADCSAMPEGAAFSEKLNRAAYTAGGLVAAGHMTEAEAEQVLKASADLARPGQERRSHSIISSGMSAGSLRPLFLGSRT